MTRANFRAASSHRFGGSVDWLRAFRPALYRLTDLNLESGRNVIEGRADQIELNGIDQWLGGVHLKGDRASWRWDATSLRLVPGRTR